MIEQVIDSSNVRNCADPSPCYERPCENNGVCIEAIKDYRNSSEVSLEYRCLCKAPYTGDHCQYNRGFCALNRPCQNQGVCIEGPEVRQQSDLSFDNGLTKGGYRCCCSIGFTGAHCEIVEQVHRPTCALFEGSSFLVLDRRLLPHNSSQDEEVIEFTFRTHRFNGLLVYQGDPDLEDRDYLMIALIDGYLQAVWELGSGPGTIA